MRISFTISFPRWYKADMLSAMHAAAKNCNIGLTGRTFGGLISIKMSCTAEGAEQDVRNYLAWIQRVAALNS